MFQTTFDPLARFSDGTEGGRPTFDPVVMFKLLVVQAQQNPSDPHMECIFPDWLSWMCTFGFYLWRHGV